MSGRVFIALGSNCWGVHEEKKKAVAQMKRRWPAAMQKSGKFEVWSCPPQSVVSGGQIVWAKDAGHPAPVLVSRGDVNQGGWLR